VRAEREEIVMTVSERQRPVPDVASIMSRTVIAVTPDFTASEVAQVLNRYRISMVPVVSSVPAGDVVGIISEKDCLESIANRLFYDQFTPETAASIMKPVVISAHPDQSIFDLESIFSVHGIRLAPVVDAEGHLVGMVSGRDMLKAFEQLSSDVVARRAARREPLVLDQKTRIEMLLSRPE
jgi:CBS domain-containing protein